MQERKDQIDRNSPPKENVERKKCILEEKELKRKNKVSELMRKFENAPVTPMKERRMLTPKRRKKID